MADPTRPIPVNIEDEVRTSFLDYAMSVIVSRALPDVRDGLKPVHRRILYAMFREGILSSKRFSKCAGVVGEVLKKYHPHGDASVYDALVRLAQEWNMRYLLVDGQGNFGSVDGDPAAAYRYTEARLSKFAEEMLADIDMETVDFRPNFDESTEEPVVLPTRVPNLLVNGAAGIAVGMATNIPPHNLREVVDATLHLIENPGATIKDLMHFVHGPDFPTAGLIYGADGIASAYQTGRGQVIMRARTATEPIGKTDRTAIVVTELPYQVNKARLVEKIADLVREKRIEGISDLRDESSREGMRIVIELKRDANPTVVINQLYKNTPMQESFGVLMLAIVGGRPQVLTLKELLEHFIAHRKVVVTRRTRFLLRKAEERLHILDGLKIAVDNIDEVIKIIRAAASTDVAKTALMARFKFSDLQAQAILDMRLAKLTGLEREKLLAEIEEVTKAIAEYKLILGDEKKLFSVIAEELREVREKYGDDRRTEIIRATGDISVEDMIKEEDMVVTISHAGYVKRNPVSVYRAQRRGGRGKTGMGTREEDFVENLFVASTHSYVLIFTEKGKVFWLKVHEIPLAGRTAKGKPIVNLVPVASDDRVAAILPVKDFEPELGAPEGETGRCVVLITAKATIKKTDLINFSNPRPSGIIAATVNEGDRLIQARLTINGKGQSIFIATKGGMCINFADDEVRPMGRSAAGVRAISLDEGDEVIAMEVLDREGTILTVAEKGYGKRTPTSEYRGQGRGGKGLIAMKGEERNGNVVASLLVDDPDDAMIVTDRGKIIRMKVKDVRPTGRATMGVRLISLEDGEKVVGVARLAERDEDEGGNGGSAPESADGAEEPGTGDPGADGGDGGEGPAGA
ncbi:MAG TPA: DNA gyrase subunit A [bacterium]|nr:DNA gyrase subunit A [bacterium]